MNLQQCCERLLELPRTAVTTLEQRRLQTEVLGFVNRDSGHEEQVAGCSAMHMLALSELVEPRRRADPVFEAEWLQMLSNVKLLRFDMMNSVGDRLRRVEEICAATVKQREPPSSEMFSMLADMLVELTAAGIQADSGLILLRKRVVHWLGDSLEVSRLTEASACMCLLLDAVARPPGGASTVLSGRRLILVLC